MYKLTLEPRKGCKLVFNPRTSTEIKKVFMNDTYWYPQRIEGKRFISLNISSSDTLKKFIPLALPYGNIFGAFPINGDDVCYVYSGSLSSNRISASFGLRPLFAGRSHLSYFLPDEDFKNIVCQDIKAYIQDLLKTENSDSISLMDENLTVLKKILTTPVDTNLDLYSRFFEICCDDRCVKARLSHEESCEYCTPKVGLHPLLHVVKLVPSEVWIKKYHKDLLVYLLQQDFLVDWRDIKELDETRQRRILSEVKKIIPVIKDVQDFKKAVREIVKNLVNKHDIFKILYFLSRYEGGSATLKKIFDNLFYLLPKKTEEYLFYPKFQPKLFIDGFELHFIMMSDNINKISRMNIDLQKIFDEADFFKTGVSIDDPSLRRYRFICKIKRGSYYIDYFDFPDIIEDIRNAIKTIAKQNKLYFNEEEAWLKLINIKIETSPHFEDAALEAFSRKWVLQRKISEDIESVCLFSMDAGFEEDLDKGIIPEVLKNEFKIKGFSLSENTTIEKEDDKKWTITDNGMIFAVRKELGWLNIYELLKGKIISADVFCDYPCLASREYKFKYLRDVQSNYAALNRLLEKEFNFKVLRG